MNLPGLTRFYYFILLVVSYQMFPDLTFWSLVLNAMKMWLNYSLCSVIGKSIFTYSLVNSNT